MTGQSTRREFLAGSCNAASGLLLPCLAVAADAAKVADHTLTVIAGKPRERGKQYGEKFKDGIRAFLDKEIYRPFAKTPPTKDDLLRYAGKCAVEVKKYSPVLMDELEGMAETSGASVEELVLGNLHEELHYKLPLPIDHCTAVAVGPPDTSDGNTYVGQTWDWMPSVFGMSSMLLWKRPEGPSVLAYGYPGLWVGAGLNSAGIAHAWTSAGLAGINQPAVGIPSYLLIAHLMYQESLKAVIEEAKRAKLAGWFTFAMADGKGNLLNLEGSPKEIAVEESKGTMTRVGYGSRQMTRTPADKSVKFHARCQHLAGVMAGDKGKIDRAAIQGYFGLHEPKGSPVCNHPATIDAMLYNCTTKEAHVSRGPGCSGRWVKFTFADK